MYTIVMGIQRMVTVADSEPLWNFTMAVAMLAMLPPVVVVVVKPKSDAEPIHGIGRSRRRQEIIRQERGDQGGHHAGRGWRVARRAQAVGLRQVEALGADSVVHGRVAADDQPALAPDVDRLHLFDPTTARRLDG
jgi:hypothetical protein